MTHRAALYLRVSTDRQTTDNQAARLREIAAARRWEIVTTYDDAGISGAKGRDKRPGLDAMLKDASRRRFDVVMVWAIDRLGRSLVDLLATVQHLESCGVDLFIDQQAIDTTSPAGKLVFQICGAIAEFERSMIRARIMAGLERAKARGHRPGPAVDAAKLEQARVLLDSGMGILKTAKTAGLGTSTVQALKRAQAVAPQS